MKITPKVEHLLVLASRIAKEHGNSYIDLTAILCGLIRMDHGISGLALRNASLTESLVTTILEPLQSRKTETDLSTQSPPASANYPHAGATTPSVTTAPAVGHPTPAKAQPQDSRDTLPETTAPRNRRHIPLEEIIATQFQTKWLLQYNHSLLTAQPRDLSPLDVAFLQQTGAGTAGQNLWQSPAAIPAMPAPPQAGVLPVPCPENPVPESIPAGSPCRQCGHLS